VENSGDDSSDLTSNPQRGGIELKERKEEEEVLTMAVITQPVVALVEAQEPYVERLSDAKDAGKRTIITDSKPKKPETKVVTKARRPLVKKGWKNKGERMNTGAGRKKPFRPLRNRTRLRECTAKWAKDQRHEKLANLLLNRGEGYYRSSTLSSVQEPTSEFLSYVSGEGKDAGMHCVIALSCALLWDRCSGSKFELLAHFLMTVLTTLVVSRTAGQQRILIKGVYSEIAYKLVAIIAGFARLSEGNGSLRPPDDAVLQVEAAVFRNFGNDPMWIPTEGVKEKLEALQTFLVLANVLKIYDLKLARPVELALRDPVHSATVQYDEESLFARQGRWGEKTVKRRVYLAANPDAGESSMCGDEGAKVADSTAISRTGRFPPRCGFVDHRPGGG
jgi:hypothetical protein